MFHIVLHCADSWLRMSQQEFRPTFQGVELMVSGWLNSMTTLEIGLSQNLNIFGSNVESFKCQNMQVVVSQWEVE
jgi:hypothetical protein